MELNSQPPAISATIMQAVSNTAQRVLRSASGLPWSNRWEWRRGWVVGVPGICYCPVETSKIYYTPVYYLEERAVAHTIHGKKKLLARVRRIAGQTRALEQAVLQQIAAIRGAVNGLMNEVLEGHIREHLGAEQASAEQRREDLELVVTALRSYLK